MIKIGITGGIGSGKSTITNFFRTLGIPIYSSDLRAKMLTQNNDNIINGLKQLISPNIYDANGQLDRKLMAQLIFNNETLRLQVNQLIHPAVRHDFAQWTNNYETKVPYVICEAAIMIESGSYADMDKIIVVTAPIEQRIVRTMTRDHITRDQVISRINTQMKDEQLIRYANYIVSTDDRHFIIPQLLTIDSDIRNLHKNNTL